MAIDKPVQKKGIVTKLVHKLMEFAKLQGLKEVTCHARENAVLFYLKLQFEVYGEPFEEVGITHRYMKRSV